MIVTIYILLLKCATAAVVNGLLIPLCRTNGRGHTDRMRQKKKYVHAHNHNPCARESLERKTAALQVRFSKFYVSYFICFEKEFRDKTINGHRN